MRKIVAAAALAICAVVSLTPSAAAATDPWWYCNPGGHFVRQSQVSTWIHYGYSCYKLGVYTP